MKQSVNQEAQSTNTAFALSNLKMRLSLSSYLVTPLGDDCLMLEVQKKKSHKKKGTAISEFPSRSSKVLLIKILPFYSQISYLVMRLDESQSDLYTAWNQTYLTTVEEVCAAIDTTFRKMTNGNPITEFH